VLFKYDTLRYDNNDMLKVLNLLETIYLRVLNLLWFKVTFGKDSEDGVGTYYITGKVIYIQTK